MKIRVQRGNFPWRLGHLKQYPSQLHLPLVISTFPGRSRTGVGAPVSAGEVVIAFADAFREDAACKYIKVMEQNLLKLSLARS
jgi:hypothetical protein